MPLIYRAMIADGNRPEIGSTATTLGVRPADIPVDANGMVRPNAEGMSVAPAWRLLPPHRIPGRLKPIAPDARGSNKLFCWRMGAGPFTAGPVAADLLFRPDPAMPAVHGFVEPDQEMLLADYQAALAATQDQWVIDEA